MIAAPLNHFCQLLSSEVCRIFLFLIVRRWSCQISSLHLSSFFYETLSSVSNDLYVRIYSESDDYNVNYIIFK
jgi:hypothetical protein